MSKVNRALRFAACFTLLSMPLLAQYAPTDVSVSPSSGNGNPQTFRFTASSPLGYTDIGGFQVIFNTSLTAVNGCYMWYTPSINWISLANNANNAWVGGGYLGTSGTLANSQCQLNLAASSYSGSGNDGTLSLAITFLPALLSQINVYLATTEVNTGANTGWQQMGTWSAQAPAPLPPVDVSVSPASGSGTTQTFRFTASTSVGWTDIGTMQIIFNSSLTAVNGCYMYFSPAVNWISLANDANNAWVGGGYLGSSNTFSNDQCQLSLAASSFSGSGTTLTLSLSLTFLQKFAGQQNSYLASSEVNTGACTGWQQMGTWTVPGAQTGLKPRTATAGSCGQRDCETEYSTLTFVSPNTFYADAYSVWNGPDVNNVWESYASANVFENDSNFNPATGDLGSECSNGGWGYQASNYNINVATAQAPCSGQYWAGCRRWKPNVLGYRHPRRQHEHHRHEYILLPRVCGCWLTALPQWPEPGSIQ